MADIFISYKKEDRDRVATIVDGLRAEGFDLWWDQDIGAGETWDDAIKTHLDGAKCVVAIWSSLSVTAPWVKEEAGHGKTRGILVPARIHDVEPPLGFGLIQAADLRVWKGDREDKNWKTFVANVRTVLRGAKVAQLIAPQMGRARMSGVALIGAVGAIALAALSVSVFRAPPPAPRPQIIKVTTPVAAPRPILSAAEQSAWADALAAKTRKPYEDYLKAYPNGRFVDDAKAALATCRNVPDEHIEAFERKLNVHGNTSAEAFGDRESALLSARDDGQKNADRTCQEIAEEAKVDDMSAHTEQAMEPMCTPMGATATTCSASLWVTCTGKKKTVTAHEICG